MVLGTNFDAMYVFSSSPLKALEFHVFRAEVEGLSPRACMYVCVNLLSLQVY